MLIWIHLFIKFQFSHEAQHASKTEELARLFRDPEHICPHDEMDG